MCDGICCSEEGRKVCNSVYFNIPGLGGALVWSVKPLADTWAVGSSKALPQQWMPVEAFESILTHIYWFHVFSQGCKWCLPIWLDSFFINILNKVAMKNSQNCVVCSSFHWLAWLHSYFRMQWVICKCRFYWQLYEVSMQTHLLHLPKIKCYRHACMQTYV